jgi:hypothetical protein
VTLRDYWRKWLDTGLDPAEAFVFACVVVTIVWAVMIVFYEL